MTLPAYTITPRTSRKVISPSFDMTLLGINVSKRMKRNYESNNESIKLSLPSLRTRTEVDGCYVDQRFIGVVARAMLLRANISAS
jgi:hypothetical protein